jgi:ankyrin repeat protein
MEELLLINAAQVGNAVTIRRLAAEGMDVNVQDGARPLHWAAGYGHVDAICVLVEVGAEVEASDADGRTPLHCAAQKGHVAVVKMLVEAGQRCVCC